MAASTTQTDDVHRGLISIETVLGPVFKVFGDRVEGHQTGADRVYLGKLIGFTYINERGTGVKKFVHFTYPEGWHRAIHEARSLTQPDCHVLSYTVAKSA